MTLCTIAKDQKPFDVNIHYLIPLSKLTPPSCYSLWLLNVCWMFQVSLVCVNKKYNILHEFVEKRCDSSSKWFSFFLTFVYRLFILPKESCLLTVAHCVSFKLNDYLNSLLQMLSNIKRKIPLIACLFNCSFSNTKKRLPYIWI